MTEASERTAAERLEALQALHAMLATVAREIGPALELQPVLETVLAAMRSLVDFRGGTIGLVDERGVYVAASDPPVTADVMALRVPVGTGLAGRVVMSGETVYSADVRDDPRVDPALRVTGTNAPMRSYLAVPLVCLGQVIGVLQVDSALPAAFDDDDRLVLEGLAVQVAGAIESARRHEEMLELEQRKSDFTARVSHELRTPLTIITGLVATLQSNDENLTDDQRYWLTRLHAAGQRLHVLIEELLALSRMETGVVVPQPELLDIADLFARVRAEAAAPEHLTVLAPPGATVQADPLLLRQCLNLLVDNALKYAGHAVLEAEVDGASVTSALVVRDQGPGIAPELRERIFERFVRGDSAGPGMGLGLAIVRNLAAAAGARVELGEPDGGGAAFALRLDPVAHPDDVTPTR